jgi:hypothetical protein
MGEKKVRAGVNRRPIRPSKWTASERGNRGGSEMERKIKNSFKLLSDIAEGLNKVADYETRVLDLNVSFCENRTSLQHFSLSKALELIVEDCPKNDFTNWSNADSAKVWTYDMLGEGGLQDLIFSMSVND